MNDSLFPQFAKSSGMGSRSNAPRDPKKDGRNMATGGKCLITIKSIKYVHTDDCSFFLTLSFVTGKGSAKMSGTPSGSGSHKPVIHVSLSLKDEVKLNESKDPWKPSKFKRDTANEEEYKTQVWFFYIYSTF